jgi:hypothetical protein
MNCGHVPEVRETTCRISRRRVDDRVVSRYTGRLWTENIIIIIIKSHNSFVCGYVAKYYIRSKDGEGSIPNVAGPAQQSRGSSVGGVGAGVGSVCGISGCKERQEAGS